MAKEKYVIVLDLKAGDILSDGNIIKSITIPNDKRASDEVIILYKSGESFYCEKTKKFKVIK